MITPEIPKLSRIKLPKIYLSRAESGMAGISIADVVLAGGYT
jgi:hypothetical protein